MEGDWLIQSVSRRGWYLTVDNLGPFLGLIITEYPAAWQIAIRYQGPEQVVIVRLVQVPSYNNLNADSPS